MLTLILTYNLEAKQVKKVKNTENTSGGKAMKVLMIIAKTGFRDEEYFDPREVLQKAGIEIVTASSSLGEATGMLGGKTKVDTTIDKIKVSDYDGIIFVGGIGSKEYWNNSIAHQIVQEAVKHDKVLSAICIAPITLAYAGVLKGKKATVYESEIDKLKNLGAVYTGNKVEVDGKIVTGSGPAVAKLFGEKVRDVLLKK
ncbi:MAG: DJ-1/PfpI family protein [Endomicrobiia bacterium]